MKCSRFQKTSRTPRTHGTVLSAPFGFTLLELMISLTIVGLVLVIVFGALRIGVRAWEKGEKEVDIHQRQRVVLNLLKAQMASISAEAISGEEADQFLFKGEADSMSFISNLPIVPTNTSGMVFVRYMIERADQGNGYKLMVYEKSLAFIDKKKEMKTPNESEFFELIPAAKGIQFEYLPYPENEEETPEWQESFDSENDKGNPIAVRIVLQQENRDAPLIVVARLEAKQ